MGIATAVQVGNYIRVYDEKRRHLCSIPSGTGYEKGLVGYTSSTVSVRNGNYIYIYDETGRKISSVPAR